MNIKRRILLKAALMIGAMVALFFWWRPKSELRETSVVTVNRESVNAATDSKSVTAGMDTDGFSRVYMVKDGTPSDNMRKAVELMGGIESFIGPADIVVLKPNSQWWRQGMTNTDAMQAFIDMVLAIPAFAGEIIVADNHQFHGADSRGWTTNDRNGRFNLNELVDYYEKEGHLNVSKYHWQVAGTTAVPLQGDAQGDRRVAGPGQGDGYVWMKDTYYLAPSGRKCLMTYPVFTSSYSGITIDLKNGAWQDGRYLPDKPVRFINFSALNHHSRYSGVTASVKNFMGVVDMTCGFPGDEPQGTYNTHHIGVSRSIMWTRQRVVWRLGNSRRFMDYCYRNFHHTGGALGTFMRHVRMPDLNVITAEYVGWGSRTNAELAIRPRTILTSRDPVALDYIAARDVLCVGTPPNTLRPEGDLTYKELNDPDNHNGPFRRFLAETARQGVGTLDAARIKVVEHRFQDNRATPA